SCRGHTRQISRIRVSKGVAYGIINRCRTALQGRPAPSPENQGVNIMSRVYLAGMAAALITALTIPAALAQQPTPPAQPQRPQIETKKVDGTDNVYIFRNGNHQAMFIVTDEGVIATDPVAYGRP